ncbi:MAG: transferase hexapeptide repeat containing protein [Planctomycetes bacterium]|nr:transferase hexapeptide repeat containing protein [Planctomycetota bacterium]
MANLEAEVAQIKDQLQRGAKPQNWLDRVVGSMSRYPEFREVLRLGRELRQADRPVDKE